MSFERNAAAQALLLDTLQHDVPFPRRWQFWSDPSRVSQFAAVYDHHVGFLTRPQLLAVPNQDDIAVGSFSDTIGECVPVSVSGESLMSWFTTLVRRADAEALGLEIHPIAPEGVVPPLADPADDVDDANATLARLHFGPIVDDGDRPVIVALPLFLPLPPGQSFPEGLNLGDPESFRDSFLYFEVWRQGHAYVRNHNDSTSVTLGGPLFHLPSLAVAPPNTPFQRCHVVTQLPDSPALLSPVSAHFLQCRAAMSEFSDDAWARLGELIAPVPAVGAPPVAAGGISGDQFKELVGGIFENLPKTASAVKEAEHTETANEMACNF